VHASLTFAHITLINSLCSKEYVFLSYNPNHKGYKCYHIESGRMYISRDVVFHETKFPFAASSSHTKSYATQPAPFIPPLHIPAPTPTRPTPPPPSSTSSHSSSAEPSVTHPHSNIEVTPPSRIHPMRTRAQNNIIRQRKLTDGTIRYHVPRTLSSCGAYMLLKCSHHH